MFKTIVRTVMESTPICDNSNCKLRPSTRSPKTDLNYLESCDETSDISVKNSKQFLKTSLKKKRTKRSSSKSNISKCDELKHKLNADDTQKNNGLKLFPIFSPVSHNSKLQHNSEVGDNDEELKSSLSEQTVQSLKIALALDETSSIEFRDDSSSEDAVVTVKRKRRKTGNKKKEVVSEKVLEPSVSTNVDTKPILKKCSILDSFKKIQDCTIDKSDNKSAEGIHKLFPIFNNSVLMSTNKDVDALPPKVKDKVHKKRKIKETANPLKLRQPASEINDRPIVETSKNILNANSSTITSSEDEALIVEPLSNKEECSHSENIRKKLVKKLKTNKTYSAAILRSCSHRSISSQVKKVDKSLNLDPSLIKSSKSIIDEKDEMAQLQKKKNLNRLKPDILKLLPQSHTCFKGFKDNRLISKTKNVDNNVKFFPLFAKSHATSIKNKSIEHINSLARKKVGSAIKKHIVLNGSVELKQDNLSEDNTKKDNFPNNIKKKRGRPRKVQKDVTSETEELNSKEATEKDIFPDNFMTLTNNYKKKRGRPRKMRIDSDLKEEKVELKLEQNNSCENHTEKDIFCDSPMVAYDIGKKRGRPRKVTKGPVVYEELNLEQDHLSEDNIKKDVISDELTTVANGSKKKRGRPSKMQKAALKKMSSPEMKNQMYVELSDDSIEEENASKNALENKVHFGTPSQVDDVNKTTNLKEMNTEIVSTKQGNILRKFENFLSFPLFSHCDQLASSSDFKILKYVLMDEDTTDSEVNIPLWDKVIGVTDVKSIAQLNMTDNVNKVDVGLFVNEVNSTHAGHIRENNGTLWTDIAHDYNLGDGESESTISELTIWLSQWKSKFSKNVKRKLDKDDSSDSFSCDSDDSDSDSLSNSVVLMGPPGSGKTSLVFSLANEHGFKVLEVNASSCRSGRNISHQLKEALESYHVENLKAIDVNPVKEKDANIFSHSNSARSKGAISKQQTNKGIVNYFQKEKSSDVNKEDTKKTSSVKNFFQVKPTSSTKLPQDKKSKIPTNKMSSQSSNCNEEVLKDSNLCSISTHTIILFDDIDVVFQEDEGLWSTIRGFLKISKKPVIFTVSRNLAIVKANLDLDIRVLHLKPMIKDIVMQKLQYQYRKHHKGNSNLNMKFLTCNSSDVRQNLLHAQFWSQPLGNNHLPLPVSSSEKLLSINSFLLGSFEFSAADFSAFVFSRQPLHSFNLISDYHKIGYDILHSNLYSIFNVTKELEEGRKWKVVTRKCSKLDESLDSDSDSKPESINSTAQCDLWEEACKIYYFKKRALQKGSSSDDLFLFSDILEDFSFVDSLKGTFCRNMNWMSLSERVKKWTCGLPVCNDEDFDSAFILDATSLVQILKLQGAQKRYSQKHELIQDKTGTFVLEHPFLNSNSTNEQSEIVVENIASAFPIGLCLSKAVLNVDYLSTLKIMCHEEFLKQTKSGKRSKRFLHYFDSISLLIDKFQIDQILQ